MLFRSRLVIAGSQSCHSTNLQMFSAALLSGFIARPQCGSRRICELILIRRHQSTCQPGTSRRAGICSRNLRRRIHSTGIFSQKLSFYYSYLTNRHSEPSTLSTWVSDGSSSANASAAAPMPVFIRRYSPDSHISGNVRTDPRLWLRPMLRSARRRPRHFCAARLRPRRSEIGRAHV